MCYYTNAPVEVHDFNAESETATSSEVVVSFSEPEPYNVLCSCVTYLREIKGLNIRGDAKDIKSNVDRPYVGGVVLQDINGVAHASLIVAILPNKNLLVDEANNERCKITERVIVHNSTQIRGYWFSNPNSLTRR